MFLCLSHELLSYKTRRVVSKGSEREDSKGQPNPGWETCRQAAKAVMMQ